MHPFPPGYATGRRIQHDSVRKLGDPWRQSAGYPGFSDCGSLVSGVNVDDAGEHQSAYRRNFSTETALLYTSNNFFQSSYSGKSTFLILLDLSAAFDTIDHSILLSHLNTSFGLTHHTVYSWLQSYLTGRHQSVLHLLHVLLAFPRDQSWGPYFP